MAEFPILPSPTPEVYNAFERIYTLLINWLSSPVIRVRKEAVGTRLSGHASLLSFQTQKEQAVFIRLKVGKVVARVRNKNIQAEG